MLLCLLKKRLQFLAKLCQQRYGDLKKVTSARDHRQKGSTRGQFYCLKNRTILLPTTQDNSTAYRTGQFYCPQNRTILLPTKQDNSAAYKTGQFYCLQNGTILLPTKQDNSAAYKTGQFYCLQNRSILLTTKQGNYAAYKTGQFYCLQNRTILLPIKEDDSTAYKQDNSAAFKTGQFYCLQKHQRRRKLQFRAFLYMKKIFPRLQSLQTGLLYNGYNRSVRGDEVAGGGVHHQPHLTPKLKKEYYYSPSGPSWPFLG
jgi:hypothetical protein